MSEDAADGRHSPEEIRSFLTRLSRDKRAVSAHLGFRVDLEHASFGKSDRFPQEKKVRPEEDA
jgi:hypothetical protein